MMEGRGSRTAGRGEGREQSYMKGKEGKTRSRRLVR